jgi:enoyl-CoA hydratase/carnithine racemase
LVGEGWVKRMILLGERVDAATSLRIGLVEDVVSKGDGKAHAIEWARQAVKQSLASIAACKRLVQSTRTQTHGDALVSEREAIVDLFDGTDQKGGVSAFLEKRPPRWKNA